MDLIFSRSQVVQMEGELYFSHLDDIRYSVLIESLVKECTVIVIYNLQATVARSIKAVDNLMGVHSLTA